MKKVFLFLGMLFVSFSSLAIEIRVQNNTNCSCNISPNLRKFNLWVHYQSPSGRIELPPHTNVTLTLLPKTDKMIERPDELVFLLEDGWILKQVRFKFPVVLDLCSDIYVPFLRGKKHKNVARLNGKNGFSVQKSMNERHDTYVFEIFQGEPLSKDDIQPVSVIDATPLLTESK